MKKRTIGMMVITGLLLISIMFLGACKSTATTATTQAQPVTLHFANFDPPVGFAGAAHQAFADELEKRTNGRYKVEIAWGGAMGKTEDHYDLVRNGVADISYFLSPLTPGLFPASDIISLPWRLPNASVSCNALWNFYQQGYLDDEYSEVVPVFLWAGSGQSIFTVDPINTLNDIKGMKIISHSDMNNQILGEYMGAVPMFIPHGEMYGAVEKGTADGLFLVWEGIAPFSLQDQLHYAVDLTFGNIGCVVAMNKNTYNTLPADVKEIIRQIAQDTLLPKTIEGYGNAQQTSKTLFSEAGGQYIQWSEADMATLEAAISPMWQQWIAKMEAAGLPGKDMVDSMYQILQDLGVDDPGFGYKP